MAILLIALALGLFFWLKPGEESNQTWGAVRPIKEQTKREKQEAKLKEILPPIPPRNGIEKDESQSSANKLQAKTLAKKSGLLGCSVCGYLAIEKANALCQNCGIVATDSAWNAEGLTKTAFLQREQLDYFSRDTVDFKVDIMGPKVSDKGFLKDSLWKPQRFITPGRVQEFISIKIQALKK